MTLPQGVEMSHIILARFLSPGDWALDATCGNGHDTLFLARLVGKEGRVVALDIQEEAVVNTRSRVTDSGFSNRVQVIRGDHSNLKNNLMGNLKNNLTGNLKNNFKSDLKNNFNIGLKNNFKSNLREIMQEITPAEIAPAAVPDDKNKKERTRDNRDNKKQEDNPLQAKFQGIIFNLGFLPGSTSELITTPKTTLLALKQSLDLLAVGGVLVIVAYTGHEGGDRECQQILAWAAELDYKRYNVMHNRFINQPNDPPQLIAIEKR